jgi:hypothetical protein
MYAETPRNKHAAPNLVQDQNKRTKKKKKKRYMHLYFKTVQVKPKHPFKNSPYQKHRDRKKKKKTPLT